MCRCCFPGRSCCTEPSRSESERPLDPLARSATMLKHGVSEGCAPCGSNASFCEAPSIYASSHSSERSIGRAQGGIASEGINAQGLEDNCSRALGSNKRQRQTQCEIQADVNNHGIGSKRTKQVGEWRWETLSFNSPPHSIDLLQVQSFEVTSGRLYNHLEP